MVVKGPWIISCKEYLPEPDDVSLVANLLRETDSNLKIGKGHSCMRWSHANPHKTKDLVLFSGKDRMAGGEVHKHLLQHEYTG